MRITRHEQSFARGFAHAGDRREGALLEFACKIRHPDITPLDYRRWQRALRRWRWVPLVDASGHHRQFDVPRMPVQVGRAEPPARHEGEPRRDHCARRQATDCGVRLERQFDPAVGGVRKKDGRADRGNREERRIKADRPAAQHVDRPVPEIQRIRKQADRDHRFGREHPSDEALRRVLGSGKNDESRTDHGRKCPRKRERSRSCPNQRDKQQQSTAETEPWGAQAVTGCPSRFVRQQAREARTGSKLPEAARKHVVGKARILQAPRSAKCERSAAQRKEEIARRTPARGRRPRQPKVDDEGKEQIKLLFDSQRPRVRERVVLGARVEVATTPSEQREIAQTEEGKEPCPFEQGAEKATRNESDRRDDRDAQACNQRGSDPSQAPRVETGEKARERQFAVTDERPRDDVPGYHEEDIDAHETARKQCGVQVIGHHRHHCDGAQAIDPRDVGAAFDRPPKSLALCVDLHVVPPLIRSRRSFCARWFEFPSVDRRGLDL